MISETVVTEAEKDLSLLAREKKHLTFSAVVPDDVIKVDLDLLEKAKSCEEIKSAFTLSRAQKDSYELEDLKKQTQFSLQNFIERNSDLANDPRFSDTYNYRVSSFYKNLGQYSKERDYLLKIQNKESPFYSEKIAQNLLYTKDTEAEGLKVLEKADTEDAALYVSAYWRSKQDFTKARKILDDFYKKHGPSKNINACLATDCILTTNETNLAIHYLRQSFYQCHVNDETALLISVLYLCQSAKDKRLLVKAGMWAETSFALNPSSHNALSMLVRLFQEKRPGYIAQKIECYTQLPSSTGSSFYPRAQLLKSKSFYIQKRYTDCISVLQELISIPKYSAAAWNNIAMCNEASGNYERALKNLKKAVESVCKDDIGRNQIFSNYINLLFFLGKNQEVIDFFEKEHMTVSPQVKAQYIDSFAPYVKSLLFTGNTQKAFEYLIDVFNNSSNLKVKNCAAIDLICFFYTTGSMESEAAGIAADFLLQNISTKGIVKIQNLNDAVFTKLERNEEIPQKVFSQFVSNIGCDPFSIATYGLYLFRIKNDPNRGAAFYTKAMNLSKDKELYQELQFKCRLELALYYSRNGMQNQARREVEQIVKNCPVNLPWYKNFAKKILAEF